MQLPLIVFVPFLISLILLLGYSKITAVFAIVGSMMIGIAGTTFGYTNTSLLNQALGLENTNAIWVKIIISFLEQILIERLK